MSAPLGRRDQEPPEKLECSGENIPSRDAESQLLWAHPLVIFAHLYRHIGGSDRGSVVIIEVNAAAVFCGRDADIVAIVTRRIARFPQSLRVFERHENVAALAEIHHPLRDVHSISARAGQAVYV